jgi:hypothetical protein
MPNIVEGLLYIKKNGSTHFFSFQALSDFVNYFMALLCS